MQSATSVVMSSNAPMNAIAAADEAATACTCAASYADTPSAAAARVTASVRAAHDDGTHAELGTALMGGGCMLMREAEGATASIADDAFRGEWLRR